MLTIGVVGLGNAGSQVAALAMEQLKCDVLAINSSEQDTQTLPDSVPRVLIGDQKGAGKERAAAKKFLKDGIMKILNDQDILNTIKKDVLFVVSSTGGGTGSGMALMMSDIIGEVSPTTKVVTVGILPTLKEGYSTQVNTLAYMKELYESLKDATYMIYDNDKMAKLPSTVMMNSINQSIVDDFDVLRGTYQTATKYSSIDEKDGGVIINTSGRIAIASLRDIKEKDLDETTFDELIIQQFKTNAHCELQRDKIVQRTGVISNLSDRLNDLFDSHIPAVQQFIGAPVEEFEHIVVNSDRHLPNNLFVIASGLTQINDRIRKINDRIEEINEMQKQRADESELNSVDFGELNGKIERKQTAAKPGDDMDIQAIFSKFGI